MPNAANKGGHNSKATAMAAPKSTEHKASGTKMHRRSRSGMPTVSSQKAVSTDRISQVASPADSVGRSVMREEVIARLASIWV